MRFSRRHFCVSALLAPLLRAAPPEINDDLPAETLYAIGARMLREGRSFEKAAARFALAAQKEPTNAAHQIGLGCALASRVASLSRAALWTNKLAKLQADFPKQLKAWQEGRADWKEYQAAYPQVHAYQKYEDEKPVAPPPFRMITKDDKAPFRLTSAELAVRLADLSRQAQEAWEKGITLSQTPNEKAEAYYVQAWGLQVLRASLQKPLLDEDGAISAPADKTPEPTPEIPTTAAAIKAAQEAVRLAPENALYWQAVGDCCWETAREEKAFAAYEKAIALAPKNANLLYLMYHKTLGKTVKKSKKTVTEAYIKGKKQANDAADFAPALSYLHRAAGYDRANAWALYEEAGILFRLAPYGLSGAGGATHPTPDETQGALDSVSDTEARKRGKHAVDLVLRGNALPRYVTPPYQQSVPRLLAQAWKMAPYGEAYFADPAYDTFAQLRELARALGGYALVMAKYENNLAEAVRASRASIAMGFHVIGDWPDTKNPPDALRWLEKLVGVTVVLISYRIFVKTYLKINDADGAEAVQKELDEFQKWQAEYRKVWLVANDGVSDY